MKEKGNDIQFMEQYLKKALELEKLKYSFGNACQNTQGIRNKLVESVSSLEERSIYGHKYLAEINRNEWIKENVTNYGPKAIGSLVAGLVLLIPLIVILIHFGFTIPIMLEIVSCWFLYVPGVYLIYRAIVNFKKKADTDANQMYERHLAYQNATLEEIDTALPQEISNLEHYDTQCTTLVDQYNAITNELAEHYSLGVLDESYCNFVAVGTLYSYIRKGMCDTVRGHGGIYDTYEYHVKINMIVTKLDQIIRKLDVIANNQQYLYYAIKEGNEISRQICSEIQAGNKLTQEQLDAYRQERYERSTRNW